MNNRKFLVSMTALVAALATESALANTDTSSQVNLAVSSQSVNSVEANKGTNQFNFILKTADSQTVMAYHGSHRSHYSHRSHRSHYSGR